jgi:hypothetical protein
MDVFSLIGSSKVLCVESFIQSSLTLEIACLIKFYCMSIIQARGIEKGKKSPCLIRRQFLYQNCSDKLQKLEMPILDNRSPW